MRVASCDAPHAFHYREGRNKSEATRNSVSAGSLRPEAWMLELRGLLVKCR